MPFHLRALLAACAVLVVGCQTPFDRKDEQQFGGFQTYSAPIESRRSHSAGATAEYSWFRRERLALVAALTPVRFFFRDGRSDVYAFEGHLGLRYYPWAFDLFGRPSAVSFELMAGLMWANTEYPDRGTSTNFLADGGVRLESEITESWSWILGYRLKHLSNGYILGDQNPSENAHAIYFGAVHRW